MTVKDYSLVINDIKDCKDCTEQGKLCQASGYELPLFCKQHSKLWNNLRKNLWIEESQNFAKVSGK